MSTPLPTLQELAATLNATARAEASAVPESAAPEVVKSAEVPTAEPEKAPESEAAPEKAAEVTEPAKKDPTASRFAALTRKERELRQRDQESTKRMQAAEAREKAAEERAKAAEAREARLADVKKSPYKVLRDLGLSMQDVVNDSLNQYDAPAADPIAELAKKIEDLQGASKSEVEVLRSEITKLTQELQEKDYKSAISEVTDNIVEVVSTNSDKYELMAEYGQEAVDLAKDVIREYFKQNEKLLSYSEACDIVEKHYEDEFLTRVMKTKKAQSRLGTQEAAKTTPKQSAPKEAAAPNTLTNRAATAASEAKVDINTLSREDALSHLAKKYFK